MLSKRNMAMILTMTMVILILFLSSVVLKEYFNDYDVNHAVQTALIERKEPRSDTDGIESGSEDPASDSKQVLYIGTEDNGYYPAMKEWADYRKKSFRAFASLSEAREILLKSEEPKAFLLVDGELLEPNITEAAELLSQYVTRGGVVIFYRLPSYQAIQDCASIQTLLGIQHLRAESVALYEIWLYEGFLLGGETCYSMEEVEDPKRVDLEAEIPWYDISSRTKTYMVGYLKEADKDAMGLNNEDLPAIIWRSSLGKGFAFAVNGDYMQGETCIGMLDAMVYEAEDYAIYSVVNAQNLLVTGFPDLTIENEERMAEIYGMTTQQFCRDVLWPSLVASAQKGNWKITSFVSTKQSDQSKKKPSQEDLIDYLKYFNEESAEAGISLGRMESQDIWKSVEDEKDTLENWNLDYMFAAGYARKENKDKIPTLIDKDGKMEYFRDIRTVVGEYEEEESILSWMTDQITLQNASSDAYRHSYKDSLRLKSLETALGYSNIQVDMYRILWPKSREDEWQSVAEKMAAHIDTYWKPFSTFDKTTISESDRRVRNFLNGSVESFRKGDQITIVTEDFTEEAYLLLRTHGDRIEEMTGGTWKQIEEEAYLLHLTEANACVTLKSELAPYYKE